MRIVSSRLWPSSAATSADPPSQPGAEQRHGGTDAVEHARHRRVDLALPAGFERRDPYGPRFPRKTCPSATTGRIALRASRTSAFKRHDTRLVALTSFMKAFPERGCRTRSDHVRAEEFVYAQPGVQQGGDDHIGHRSGSFGFATDTLTLNRTGAAWRQRLIGDRRRLQPPGSGTADRHREIPGCVSARSDQRSCRRHCVRGCTARRAYHD